MEKIQSQEKRQELSLPRSCTDAVVIIRQVKEKIIFYADDVIIIAETKNLFVKDDLPVPRHIAKS